MWTLSYWICLMELIMSQSWGRVLNSRCAVLQKLFWNGDWRRCVVYSLWCTWLRQACTYKPGAALNGFLSRISAVSCLIWYQYESTVSCLIIMSVIGALICFAHLYNALYSLAVSGFGGFSFIPWFCVVDLTSHVDCKGNAVLQNKGWTNVITSLFCLIS